MPVIVLAGDEEFAMSRRLAELRSTLLSPPWHTVNFIKFKGVNTAWQEATSTMPFGQGKRIILVDNCDLFTKKRTKTEKTDKNADENISEKIGKSNKISKSNKAENVAGNNPGEDFESILKSIPENTYLIFYCPHNFDSSLKLSKSVSQYASVEEFPKEKYFPGSRNPKLESWCRQEAKRHAATIDDAAIQYLLVSTEANLRQVVSEIEKVVLAILPKTAITYDVVSRHCSPQGHIFQFIDLWLSGQTGAALDNLKELLAQQNVMPVLATLQTMLSKWIKLKSLYEKYSAVSSNEQSTPKQPNIGETAKKIAADLRLMPFSVEKDLRRLQKYSASMLVDKRLQLTRLEYAIKIGQIPGEHALVMFISSS